jgi:hypothetical protein
MGDVFVKVGNVSSTAAKAVDRINEIINEIQAPLSKSGGGGSGGGSSPTDAKTKPPGDPTKIPGTNTTKASESGAGRFAAIRNAKTKVPGTNTTKASESGAGRFAGIKKMAQQSSPQRT